MMTEVDFLYILKENEDVQIEGTVFIPEDEDADDSEYEIEYRTPNGVHNSIQINHYGVGLTQAYPDDKQNWECDKLKEAYTTDFLFLTRICDYADSNTAIDLGEVIMVINDCDYKELLSDEL